MFAQVRTVPQRVKASAVLPRVASWADISCSSLGCRLSTLSPPAHLAASRPRNRSPASPTPPQPRAFGSASPAPKGWSHPAPLLLPANPTHRGEAPLWVRQPRPVLFVWSSHSASSQAIFRCISRARQLFLQRRASRSPGNRGDGSTAPGSGWLLVLSPRSNASGVSSIHSTTAEKL